MASQTRPFEMSSFNTGAVLLALALGAAALLLLIAGCSWRGPFSPRFRGAGPVPELFAELPLPRGQFHLRTVDGHLVAQYSHLQNLHEFQYERVSDNSKDNRYFAPVHAWEWDDLDSEPARPIGVRIRKQDDWARRPSEGRLWRCVANKRHLELVQNTRTKESELLLREWDGALVKTLFDGDKGVGRPLAGVNIMGAYAVLCGREGLLRDGERRYWLNRVGVADCVEGRFEWVFSFRSDTWGSGPRVSISIVDAAISQDGSLVGLCGSDGKGGWAAVVDVASGSMLWRKTFGEALKMNAVVLSPDGARCYAGGGGGQVYGFDARTGEVLSKWLIGEGDRVEYGNRLYRLAISPDGSLVAGGDAPLGRVYVWDTATGERVYDWVTGDATIMGLAFSPDGTKLATSGVRSETVKTWRIEQEGAGATPEE